MPKVTDPSITVLEKLVLKDLAAMETTKLKIRHNLSEQDSIHLKALANDDTITIKPADKGGALVVLDTVTYINEIDRQLSDVNFYRKISHDPTLAIQKLIKVVLSEGLALDYITKDVFDFLFVEYP